MASDLTALDSYGWEALKKSFNQRLVLNRIRLVPSKRNRVWVAETDVRPVVIKQFLSGRAGNEFEELLVARKVGIDVPYPLFMDGDYLMLEYVQGDTCDTMINHLFSSEVAENIGIWLAGFHEKMPSNGLRRIRGDSVLSNFVFSEGRIFGLDLEDSGPGDPLDDLGQIGASILGSEPFFTPIKFDLCIRLIESYGKEARADVVELARPYVSKHLRLDAKAKPLFRRSFLSAAKSIERGWPDLA
ncbi:MAG: hypothetical protein KJ672_00600 [Candidatus Thermoplasmatota archaeon]|nr:hypothetical protein [Candidatus Thermoplasmatota archaeon]